MLEHHEAELFAEAPSATVPGTLAPSLLSPGLASHLRETIEHQRRFPLELVQELCRQFEGQGLRFFKENKKETFVSRSRPRPLEATTAVSDRVKSIVQFIRDHAKSTYKEVVIGLVPQAGGLVAPKAPAPAPAEPAPAPATPAEAEPASASADPAPAAATPSEAEPAEPTAADREGIAILQDLRWLIREGYVTEFADGQLRVVERQEKPADADAVQAPPPASPCVHALDASAPAAPVPARDAAAWTRVHDLDPRRGPGREDSASSLSRPASPPPSPAPPSRRSQDPRTATER